MPRIGFGEVTGAGKELAQPTPIAGPSDIAQREIAAAQASLQARLQIYTEAQNAARQAGGFEKEALAAVAERARQGIIADFAKLQAAGALGGSTPSLDAAGQALGGNYGGANVAPIQQALANRNPGLADAIRDAGVNQATRTAQYGSRLIDRATQAKIDDLEMERRKVEASDDGVSSDRIGAAADAIYKSVQGSPDAIDQTIKALVENFKIPEYKARELTGRIVKTNDPAALRQYERRVEDAISTEFVTKMVEQGRVQIGPEKGQFNLDNAVDWVRRNAGLDYRSDRELREYLAALHATAVQKAQARQSGQQSGGGAGNFLLQALKDAFRWGEK